MSKTVLLTGTSSGLGEAAAKLFLEQGWRVVATARKPEEAVRNVTHANLMRTRLDVTDKSSIDDAFAEAIAKFGSIDVVVNNAGIGLGGPLEAISLSDIRAHFEVNVIGVAAVCQVAISYMRSRQEGTLINVSSLAGRVGLPFLSPYSAGKFAVEGLTESLFYELRPFGIHVKLVEPGGIRSAFTHPWKSLAAYDPGSTLVHDTMTKGAAQAALPDVVAKTVISAALDQSDQLRYSASDAGKVLLLQRLLPNKIFRSIVGKAFGLGGGEKK